MNTQTSVSEGNLIFSFPTGWKVDKFDSWKEYAKAQGASDISGCDVVAVGRAREPLILIEVKDYSRASNQLPNPLDLGKTVARKVLGTLGLLNALRFSSQYTYPASLARIAAGCTTIQVVLHIELAGVATKKLKGPLANIQNRMRRVSKQISLPAPIEVTYPGDERQTIWHVTRQ
ncbi:hypothetical protein L1C91_02935 [Corynebacterium argentoratense]|nr:hypothetical protein [Corynebacterium argentoratense]